MSNLFRKIINSLLPEGAVWTVAEDSDLDKYLDAQADNYDDIFKTLSDLSKIRDPLLTPLLEELEREYGISLNENLTEQQRRDFLFAFAFASDEGGTREELQERLQEAGFAVQVHANDPAIDPLILIDQVFRMVAGGQNAFAGREDAFARREGGELIVNGDKFKEVPDWLSVAGGPNSSAGNASLVAGRFNELIKTKIIYQIPADPGDWPLIFFIGGDATRDIDGKITAVDTIIEPAELRQEFLKIILKYKPLHTWAVSVVDFI